METSISMKRIDQLASKNEIKLVVVSTPKITKPETQKDTTFQFKSKGKKLKSLLSLSEGNQEEGVLSHIFELVR